MTPLAIAVLRDDLELVMTLLRHGADVNAMCTRTFYQWTALHAACFRGDFLVVQCLVQHGADLHRPDYQGLYAMTLAAVRGQAAVLEFLIQVKKN